jgi:hypothetical protein
MIPPTDRLGKPSADRPLMLLSRLRQFVTTSDNKTLERFWLALSLGFAAYYALLGMRQAFQSTYVVQDDAREYVFWMQRFIDPGLLPNDLIADYFKSVTPLGYAAVYQLMAQVGIDPLTFSKLLPIALGLLITVYGFKVSLQLFPVPAAGFVAMQLLNQGLWLRSDLAAAAPRSFATPLLLAFVYYLLRGSWWAIGVVVILQALFYPLLLFISLGILFARLVHWKGWVPNLTKQRLLIFAAITGLGFLAMLPYIISSSEFAPTVTAAQAYQMPELWTGGRHPFYDANPWKFWLVGSHSGVLPRFVPPLVWLGFLLPFLLRKKTRFPLAVQVSTDIKILSQIAAVGLGLYVAAHAVILKLFFPTRYTGHTWRIAIALAAGITFILILDMTLRACEQMGDRLFKRFAVLSLTAGIVIAVVFYPAFFRHFPRADYHVSRETALYEFLQQQPIDSLIATLADEGDNIPTFTGRSILVSREYALPFHLGYYNQIRQRAIDLLEAQYSEDLSKVQQFIQNYGVDFWVLHRNAFKPEYLTADSKSWLRSFQPAFTEALIAVEQGNAPALSKLMRKCRVVKTPQLIVLEAKCVSDQ